MAESCAIKKEDRTICQSLFHVSSVDKTSMKVEDIVPAFPPKPTAGGTGRRQIGLPLHLRSFALPSSAPLITNQHCFVARRTGT